MTKLAHIMRQLMDEQDLSTSELARRTGIGQPVIHRIIARETIDPKVSTLSAIANYFAVSISQLIGDEPLPKNRRSGSGTMRTGKFGWSQVPLLTWEEVLAWPGNKIEFTEMDYVLTDAETSPQVFALKTRDTTMRPLFPEGTTLIVDPALQPQDRDYAIVHLHGQPQAIFRQVLFDGQKIYLKPLNPDFSMVPLEEDFTFLGVVVQAKGDYK